jgi:hypothetical protein
VFIELSGNNEQQGGTMQRSSLKVMAVLLALGFACNAFAAPRVVMLEEAYMAT